MNLYIFFRGPIRPTYENVLENIKLLKSNFINHNITCGLVSWNPLEKKIFLNEIDEFYILDEPHPDSININKNRTYNFNPYNCYKQFYSADYILKKIDNKYDYIIHSRTDLKLSLIAPEKKIIENKYYTIHSKQNGDRFTNDQFAISTKKIMQKVWCFSSKEELENTISEVTIPEDIIDLKIKKHQIECIDCDYSIRELDPRRK